MPSLTLKFSPAARLVLAAALLSASFVQAAAPTKDKRVDETGDTLAKVNQTVITATEYERALALTVRQKYYHAQVPENQMDALRGEVADALITRALLLEEAKRRNIQPDRDAIKRTLAEYDQRYAGSEQWKKNRKQMLAAVTPELEAQSRLGRLEQVVRQTGDATDEQAKSYYDAHRELFVEPEQVRLSIILLRVEPSSPRTTWDKAAEEASAIVARLRKGADFAELAKVHSGDGSAQRGGDLGYLHRGMLPEGTQSVLDKLNPGDISDPVRLLEGIAVIRMEDRKFAQQRSFAEVRARAGELWRRDQGDVQWKRLAAQLRDKAVIRLNTARYPALERVAAQDGRPAAR